MLFSLGVHFPTLKKKEHFKTSLGVYFPTSWCTFCKFFIRRKSMKIKSIKNTIVKYNNDLNKISTRGWSALEMNFFIAICSQLKGKDLMNTKISFTKNELNSLIKAKTRNKQLFIDTILKLSSHLSQTTYVGYEKETIDGKEKTYYIVMPLFSMFKLDKETLQLDVQVANSSLYLFERIAENFTSYPLEDFIKIKSVYAKSLFYHLKQWKTVGRKNYTLKGFIEDTGLPVDVNIKYLQRRIIPQIEKELSVYFRDLVIETLYGASKGNPLVGYQITWTPERV